MKRTFLCLNERFKVEQGYIQNSKIINAYVNIIEWKIKIAMIKEKRGSMCDISFLQLIVFIEALLSGKKGFKGSFKDA